MYFSDFYYFCTFNKRHYISNQTLINMKKILIIALAGLMMLAFTQCGGESGTKQFKDMKKAIISQTKAVKNAKSCDELHDIGNDPVDMKEYSKEEQMTKEEYAELEKIGKEFFDLFMQKENELCK